MCLTHSVIDNQVNYKQVMKCLCPTISPGYNCLGDSGVLGCPSSLRIDDIALLYYFLINAIKLVSPVLAALLNLYLHKGPSLFVLAWSQQVSSDFSAREYTILPKNANTAFDSKQVLFYFL